MLKDTYVYYKRGIIFFFKHLIKCCKRFLSTDDHNQATKIEAQSVNF